MTFQLDWKGAEVRSEVVAAIGSGLQEFGLRHETEAKRELYPDHGVVTGTLRRSIHSAGPFYDFSGDDVASAPSSPERGGQGAELEEADGRIAVVVGSGMRYALRIQHLYGYITKSHERVFPDLPEILNKHAGQRGLT